MQCPMCGGEGRKLYEIPVIKQFGPRPISTACYFCYLKITGGNPGLATVVPGSSSGLRT